MYKNQWKKFRIRIVGIESRQESEVYYFTNGYEVCLVSVKDKICLELPAEYV